LKFIIIRDDDTNFFTPAGFIRQIYQTLLDNQLPFSLSVIPNVRADVYRRHNRISDDSANSPEYEPFIAPSARGEKLNYSVADNKELIDLINQYPQIECLQHGYSHEYFADGTTEFTSSDVHEINKKLEKGCHILQTAFKKRPKVLVPPWDTVSHTALSCIQLNYSGLYVAKYPHSILPVSYWPKFLTKKLYKRSFLMFRKLLILDHDGQFLTSGRTPETILSRVEELLDQNDIVQLVNHFWEFFPDWSHGHAYLLRMWKEVLEYLISRQDVRIVSFDELYAHLS
jgi:hypothetical protein